MPNLEKLRTLPLLSPRHRACSLPVDCAPIQSNNPRGGTLLGRRLSFCLLLFVVALSCGCVGGLSTRSHDEPKDRPYEVGLPEGWGQYVSAGRFTVVDAPFYCPTKAFGICPQVQIRWSLRNLTAEPLYIEVNYRSPNPDGHGKTGYGVRYPLRPRETRAICNSVPVWSAIHPTQVQVYLVELRLPQQRLRLSTPQCGLTTAKLGISPSVVGDFKTAPEGGRGLQLTRIRLTSSKQEPYALEFSIANPGEEKRRLMVQTSVGDPAKIDWGHEGVTALSKSKGSFVETELETKGRDTTVVQVPYHIPPDAGRTPLLGYRLVEIPGPPADADATALGLTEEHRDTLRAGGRLVSAGSVALGSAVENGLLVLPAYVPVEERATLTAQRNSEHFLFRYRPDSYAARNIDRVIKEREEEYGKLKTMLHMDLPVIVTIDLYPDMEAKGLGSGTKWTSANTVNNKHIAEVYNDSSQCDPGHELAHIFTYHFGGGGGGLSEPFAVYAETDFDLPRTTEIVRLGLTEGKVGSVHEILSSSSPSDENMLFLHYLIKRDLGKFKQFYVRTTQSQKPDDLDRASQEIYGTDLAGLERDWHSWLTPRERAPRDAPRGELRPVGLPGGITAIRVDHLARRGLRPFTQLRMDPMALAPSAVPRCVESSTH